MGALLVPGSVCFLKLLPGAPCCLDFPAGVPEEDCCSLEAPGFWFCQPEGSCSSCAGGPSLAGQTEALLDVAWMDHILRWPATAFASLPPTSGTQAVRMLRFALYSWISKEDITLVIYSSPLYLYCYLVARSCPTLCNPMDYI